jgi:signal transduction histidine kinase
MVPRLWRVAWPPLIVVLAAGAVVFGHAHQGSYPPAELALDALATAPLLVVRRWPLAALTVVTAVDAAFVIDARLPWAPAAAVAWLLALALCPLLLTRTQAAVAVALSEAAVLAAVVVPTSVNPRPWDAPLTEALAVLLLWGAGETLRARWEGAAHRAVIAGQLRELRDREVVTTARAAVARELHDVVAHHVSMIAVRAATAPYQLPGLSPDAAAVLDEIAGQARAALDELRAVLGVLRGPDGSASQAPQPTLGDLPELLERMRSSGMTVVAEIDDALRSPGGPAELCCYRVVQEALTNAARHAPGEPVALTVRHRPDAVTITITNRLCGGCTPGALVGSGLGLTGMRERVSALGGALTAGQDPAGFRVEAAIPVGRPPRNP